MYDIYTPLVSEVEASYSYEEAKDLVLKGLEALGGEYLEILKGAFKEGWVDVYENQGKSYSTPMFLGAFMAFTPMCCSTTGTTWTACSSPTKWATRCTTYYSNAAQPYPTAGYAIFVAEVATTVNEILLTKYLLKTVTDKKLKKYILNHYIDQFRTTVVRQAVFAEFRKDLPMRWRKRASR